MEETEREKAEIEIRWNSAFGYSEFQLLRLTRKFYCIRYLNRNFFFGWLGGWWKVGGEWELVPNQTAILTAIMCFSFPHKLQLHV